MVIRAEDISIADAERAPVRGRVAGTTFLGAHVRSEIEVGGVIVVAEVSAAHEPKPGEIVGIIFDPRALMCF